MSLPDAFVATLSSFVHGYLAILLVGLAPGLFWLGFFYRRDLEPEPIRLVAASFLAGAFVCFPAIWVQDHAARVLQASYPSLSESARHVINCTAIAPICEETLKFLATLLIVRRIKDFDEPLDGIIYGVSVSLGFATLENVGYLIKVQQAGFETLTATAIVRAVLSVPAHGLFACLWGYALGQARFAEDGKSAPCIRCSVLAWP